LAARFEVGDEVRSRSKMRSPHTHFWPRRSLGRLKEADGNGEVVALITVPRTKNVVKTNLNLTCGCY
jgi:hypothetical protein